MAADRLLTSWDLALLARRLAFYDALAGGRRQPTTALQAHFVAAVLGQARPSTQHEIAYVRHRDGWSAAVSRGTGAAVGVTPDRRVERTVDWIEEARLLRPTPAAIESDYLGRARGLYNSGSAQARRAGADASAWISSVLSVTRLESGLAGWTSE